MSQHISAAQAVASARNAGKPRDPAAEWLNARIERARKIGMFAEVGSLSPELARLLLDKHNSRNRAMRPSRAAEFANMIMRGEWMLTSQGISIASDGVLNNGQHRCRGVIDADETVPVLFTFGESKDAFHVIDTGARRSAADVLHIHGERNTAALAGAARALAIATSGQPRANLYLTTTQVLDLVSDHPGLVEATTPGQRFGGQIKNASTSGAVLAYYLIASRSQFAGKLPDFWERLCTGVGLTAQRDPILVLRNSAISGTYSKMRGQRAVPFAASVIIAWNLWVRKKQTVSVAWKQGDPFPEVI